MTTTQNKLTEDFVKKIAHALQEEELDIYTLTLYCLDHEDLNFFSGADRARVKRIFTILLEDTKRHADLLRLIVEMAD